ncbi:MAG: hypothetical protein A4C66_01825 [Nitrospira sp. HN-bin3]|jgi:hypothetical protein|uniref:DUF7661 family protein n=1 Tax=Nitrospira cf. moscoviensis SBR1015 TaxID=96242 RepID=UPI000A0BBA82|nr:hypothetical protein [Nitrospira cf. moscoviensis SBR1015]OQW44887.1 MAG: hypothetical protein A4C66_01825 [Nitrospira sp. HN-bin3]
MSQKQTESILFDVFGRMMQAERANKQWQLFFIGPEGTKRPVPAVVVPPELTANKLAHFSMICFTNTLLPSHPSVCRCRTVRSKEDRIRLTIS